MVVDLVVMSHEQQALAEGRCDDDERDVVRVLQLLLKRDVTSESRVTCGATHTLEEQQSCQQRGSPRTTRRTCRGERGS